MFLVKMLTWLPTKLVRMLEFDPGWFWRNVPIILIAPGVIMWFAMAELAIAWCVVSSILMFVVYLVAKYPGSGIALDLDAEFARLLDDDAK